MLAGQNAAVQKEIASKWTKRDEEIRAEIEMPQAELADNAKKIIAGSVQEAKLEKEIEDFQAGGGSRRRDAS